MSMLLLCDPVDEIKRSSQLRTLLKRVVVNSLNTCVRRKIQFEAFKIKQ